MVLFCAQKGKDDAHGTARAVRKHRALLFPGRQTRRHFAALPRKKQKPPGPRSGAGGGAVPCARMRRIVVYLTMMSSFFIASSRRPASYRKSSTV